MDGIYTTGTLELMFYQFLKVVSEYQECDGEFGTETLLDCYLVSI